MRVVLALAARLRQLAAALEVRVRRARPRTARRGRRPRGSRRGSRRTGRGSRRRRGPRISGSSALTCVDDGWMRRISRSFESTNREKNFMGRSSIRGEAPRAPSRTVGGQCQKPDAVAPRRGSRTSAAPSPSPEQRPTCSRDVGFISGFLRSGSRSPGSGRAPARRAELGRASRRSATRRAARGRPRRRVGGAGGSSVVPGYGAQRGRLVKALRRRRRAAVGSSSPRVSSVPSLPSSHRSISWVSDTSLENSAPTDSPRWMRLIASPMSGATESVVILGMRLRSRQRDRVGQDDLAQRRGRDPVDGRVGQDAVGGAGVDLGHALALERADDLDQRAGRVDLVVDDDRALAADVADDVHQLGPVEVARRAASR